MNSRRFAGWADFIETVSRPPSADVDASSTSGNKEWTWTSNYDEALRLAVTGWPEGFKQVAVKAEAITKAHAGLEMAPHYAEAGDEVDVGLFLSDDPECMVEFPLEPKRKPVVKFVVSAAISACVDAEAIYNRGAAVLAAIDLLEGAGVRVELDLDHSIRGDVSNYNHVVSLKAADDPVDRDKLAFAICHPSTLRRLIFRLHEQGGHKQWENMGGWSYGIPIDPEPNPEAVIIPSITDGSKFSTMEKATDFANDLIHRAMGLVDG